MSNRKYDVSEDKLKHLQRKEALSDSEEYSINDDTYQRAPLTRQYVEDDVIAKGAEFVDDDPVVVVYNGEKHGDEIYEDDTVVIDEQPESPVLIDDTPSTPAKTDESPVIINIPKFEPLPRTNNALEPVATPRKNTRLNEDERDYLDRDNTLRGDEERFERVDNPKPAPKVKTQKERKPINLSWLKPLALVLLIIVSIVLSIVLFNVSSSNQNSNSSNTMHNDFVRFIDDTKELIAYENALCKDFKNATEQYLIGGLINKTDYFEKLSEIQTQLNQKTAEYSLKSYQSIDVYDTRFVVIDYTKTLSNTIEMLLVLEEKTDLEIKTTILNNVNDRLASRGQQYQNITSLINTTASKYQIDSKFKEGIFYFNVEVKQN